MFGVREVCAFKVNCLDAMADQCIWSLLLQERRRPPSGQRKHERVSNVAMGVGGADEGPELKSE